MTLYITKRRREKIYAEILVAEDNEINTKLIKTILEHEGVNIHHAKNGKEAFDIYANNAIDLILMDIHMPVMNGLDATKQIRNTEKNDYHIPIIGLTANAINEDKIQFESSGIDTILLKPIEIDNLLYEMRSLIDKHGSNTYGSSSNQKIMPLNGSPDIKTGDELNHLGVNLKLVSSLRNMLIDELPQIKLQLNAHFSSQNWEVLREDIHKLLGGTAYCDVPELRKATISFQASLKEESDSLKNDFEFLLSEIDALTAT
jgi:two-component system sensor histidine kinase BarA